MYNYTGQILLSLCSLIKEVVRDAQAISTSSEFQLRLQNPDLAAI